MAKRNSRRRASLVFFFFLTLRRHFVCVCVCVLRAISAARVQARPRRRSGEKREWKTDGRDRSRRGDPGHSRDRHRLINGGQSEADGKRTIDLDRHGVPSHRQLFPCGFSVDSLTGTFSGSLARGALKRRECGKRGKGGRARFFFCSKEKREEVGSVGRSAIEAGYTRGGAIYRRRRRTRSPRLPAPSAPLSAFCFSFLSAGVHASAVSPRPGFRGVRVRRTPRGVYHPAALIARLHASRLRSERAIYRAESGRRRGEGAVNSIGESIAECESRVCV